MPGLVGWGSANTYFAKAPAVDKAGLGTKRDGNAVLSSGSLWERLHNATYTGAQTELGGEDTLVTVNHRVG